MEENSQHCSAEGRNGSENQEYDERGRDCFIRKRETHDAGPFGNRAELFPQAVTSLTIMPRSEESVRVRLLLVLTLVAVGGGGAGLCAQKLDHLRLNCRAGCSWLLKSGT